MRAAKTSTASFKPGVLIFLFDLVTPWHPAGLRGIFPPMPPTLNYTAVCGEIRRASLVFRSNATLPVGRIHSGPSHFLSSKFKVFWIIFV